MPRPIESPATVRIGDTFILDPEMDLNPSFLGVRGVVIEVCQLWVRWKTIDQVQSETNLFRLGYAENIRYERLIRVASRSRANMLGWFPKRIEADDTIPDVDWSPYE